MKKGDDIKSRRLALGLTLEEVGQHVGVGKSTVRKWETGAISNMRRDKIAKLAEILEVDPVYIINSVSACGEPEIIKVEDSPARLNPDETRLIEDFRSMNEEGQTAALAAVHGLAATGIYKKRVDPSDLLEA